MLYDSNHESYEIKRSGNELLLFLLFKQNEPLHILIAKIHNNEMLAYEICKETCLSLETIHHDMSLILIINVRSLPCDEILGF